MSSIGHGILNVECSWKETFFWGSSKAHFKKMSKDKLGASVVHLILGSIEAIPFLGQIVAIFEKIIGMHCGSDQKKSVTPLKIHRRRAVHRGSGSGKKRVFDPVSNHGGGGLSKASDLIQRPYIPPQKDEKIGERSASPSNLDFRYRQREGSLHEAAQNGDFAKIDAFGRQLGEFNSYHETPLMVAIREQKKEIVDYLLQKGANPLVDNEYGPNLFYYAIAEGSLEIIQFMFQKLSIPIPGKNIEGETPLMIAAKRGNLEIFKFLQSVGYTDINASDIDLNTVLHHAAFQGHAKLVEYLCDQGADINALNVRRSNPLMRAVSSGDPETCRILMARGADTTIKDDCGYILASLARANGHMRRLSDLVVCQESLEEQEFYYRKLFIHLWSNLQTRIEGGAYPPAMCEVMARTLSSFYPETTRTEEEEAIIHAFDRASDQMRPVEEIVGSIRQRKLTILSGGWKKHAIKFVFISEGPEGPSYLAIVNRGQRSSHRQTIELFKIDPLKVTSDLIEKIKRVKTLPMHRAESFIYDEIFLVLGGDRVLFPVEFLQKGAKGGTCTWNSTKAAYYISRFIQKKGLQNKVFARKAKEEFKLWSMHARIEVFKEYLEFHRRHAGVPIKKELVQEVWQKKMARIRKNHILSSQGRLFLDKLEQTRTEHQLLYLV